MRLTDFAIRNLPLPERGQKFYPDASLRGFGVRVSQGGAKTYVLVYGKERKRVMLGRSDVVSLAEARALARKRLAERELGAHRTPNVPFTDARDAYLARAAQKNRPGTFAGYKSRLRHIPWGRRSVGEITPRDVLSYLDTVKGLMGRRYTFVVLRAFFNFCIQNHYLDTSPMGRLKPPPKNESRDRFLMPDELRAVWHACPDDPFGRTVKLLILTGQRRGEILYIGVDDDLATINGRFTKNKRTHTFPLPAAAIPLLRQPLAWKGWGKSKERLDRASHVTDWTIHDLRRTYATIHAQLGTPPHVIEALLNHKTGIISGIAATYNRYRYLDEMRAAVSVFEKHLTATVIDPAEPPT